MTEVYKITSHLGALVILEKTLKDTANMKHLCWMGYRKRPSAAFSFTARPDCGDLEAHHDHKVSAANSHLNYHSCAVSFYLLWQVNLHCRQYNTRATVLVPPGLESSQKPIAKCCMDPVAARSACNTKRYAIAWCPPNHSLRTWGAFCLSCPRASCVIKDTDRLEKQSVVMFSVYKAPAVTCYADKEWESLIS